MWHYYNMEMETSPFIGPVGGEVHR
jgi:hypothetical protein